MNSQPEISVRLYLVVFQGTCCCIVSADTRIFSAFFSWKIVLVNQHACSGVHKRKLFQLPTLRMFSAFPLAYQCNGEIMCSKRRQQPCTLQPEIQLMCCSVQNNVLRAPSECASTSSTHLGCRGNGLRAALLGPGHRQRARKRRECDELAVVRRV